MRDTQTPKCVYICDTDTNKYYQNMGLTQKKYLHLGTQTQKEL